MMNTKSAVLVGVVLYLSFIIHHFSLPRKRYFLVLHRGEQERLPGKPSVMKQIREAQSAPNPPVKGMPEHEKKKPEPEL